jgi:hypothetical protein
MKNFKSKKNVAGISAMLAVLFLMVGCGRPFVPSKPFPAPVVDGAKVSMNFNADGCFYLVNEKGETVLNQPITFATLVESADLKQNDWMTPLESFTLYTVKGDGRAFLCNRDFRCMEGLSGEDGNNAVFSINLRDRDLKQKAAETLELFFADAKGNEIFLKNFKPLSQLLQQRDSGKLKDLKALTNFTVFLIKGSRKIDICNNNKCYCGCLHPNGDITNCNRRGRCQ